ncbi:MAG: bacteriohemerythrin [Spirochaetia bacterium]
MALVEWNESLSVGNEYIDNQHQGLINVINEVWEATRNKVAIEEFTPYIIKLIRYTREHFGDEEKMMEEKGYPYIKRHKDQHREFIEKIDSFDEKIDRQKKSANAELVVFLKQWLVTHIQKSDKAYADYAKGWRPQD